MSTVVGAGQEIYEVKDDFFDGTDWSQDVVVSVNESRGPEEVIQFW